MSPLRIVLLNDLLPPDSDGGLELSALEIGEGLRNRGHDVQFVCSNWRGTFNGLQQEAPHIHRILCHAEVRSKTESVLPRKLESLRAVERKINIAAKNYQILARFLKEERPFDVAFVFGVLGIGLGTVRSFTDHGIPVLWSIGDLALPVHFAMPKETKLYRLAFNTVGRKWHEVEKTIDFSRMLFTSEFARQEMRGAGICPPFSEVVPRAISFEPVDLERQMKDDPPTLMIASRLSPARGIHVALQALQDLENRRPDLRWRLKIAGGGEPLYVSGLNELAKPLSSRVEFLGKLPREELIEAMRRAAIVINPTVEVEGFGRTSIEAMACGAALVASDTPTAREISGNGESALLYSATDPGDLGAHLERLIEDEGSRLELARKGLRRIEEHYLFGPVLDKTERALYASARAK